MAFTTILTKHRVKVKANVLDRKLCAEVIDVKKEGFDFDCK